MGNAKPLTAEDIARKRQTHKSCDGQCSDASWLATLDAELVRHREELNRCTRISDADDAMIAHLEAELARKDAALRMARNTFRLVLTGLYRFDDAEQAIAAIAAALAPP